MVVKSLLSSEGLTKIQVSPDLSGPATDHPPPKIMPFCLLPHQWRWLLQLAKRIESACSFLVAGFFAKG
jgi:hypothetical protein